MKASFLSFVVILTALSLCHGADRRPRPVEQLPAMGRPLLEKRISQKEIWLREIVAADIFVGKSAVPSKTLVRVPPIKEFPVGAFLRVVPGATQYPNVVTVKVVLIRHDGSRVNAQSGHLKLQTSTLFENVFQGETKIRAPRQPRMYSLEMWRYGEMISQRPLEVAGK